MSMVKDSDEMKADDASSLRPRVAILLSTYNGETFLRAQLDSLAAQEGVAVEVFARDDGSSDNTVDVLRSYAHLWPSLNSCKSNVNLGPSASFLELLGTVPDDFDYYAFCDQDDVWMQDKLSRATHKLCKAAGQQPGLYCSSSICVDRDLHPIGETLLRGSGRFEEIVFANITGGNTMVMNSLAAELIRSRAPGPGVIMHDWWCILVVSALGVVVCDEKPSIFYRQHQQNVFGSSPHRLAGLMLQLRQFLKDPRGFYRIHAQVAELLRLYGDRMAPRERKMAEAFVASRRSLFSRIRYAVFGRISRFDLLGEVGTRVLILVGLY
jgi:glycosyltransferase involved in cell wall biosynthesis